MNFDAFFLATIYFGVISCSISGAMIAIDHECDLFGVVFLAVTSALGGGLIRDICLGLEPPLMFRSETVFGVTLPFSVIFSILTALGVFLFAYFRQKTFLLSEKKVERVNNVADALGLGAFAVYGAETALMAFPEGHFLLAVAMGMTTGVFGGLLRDLILRDVPFILKKRIYALASLAGSFVFTLMATLGGNRIVAGVLGIAVTFGLRLLATVFRWDMPVAVRFSEKKEETTAEDKVYSEK